MESRPPEPAIEPVYTKGNVFWRGDERFLIRGISYVHDDWSAEGKAKLDLIADVRLDDLKRDIEVFHELGLNTIRVTALSPANSHSKALELLRAAGIYVLVELFDDIKTPDIAPRADGYFNVAPYYPAATLKAAAKIVDEIADHPNVLGFIVCGDAIRRPDISKIAEVHRAAVADIKHYLQLRGGRIVPVGIGVGQAQLVMLYMLQYFTAGSQDERADFFAPDCWSWAYRSSFQISGWKTMVENFGKYPIPMFLRAYGGYVQKQRIWQEVECLYSPEMTGVFSGGCLHTYFEYGNHYGIVKIRDDGTVERKPEFASLKKRFDTVNSRPQHKLYPSYVKNNDAWTGEFPELRLNRGYATSVIPRFSGSWEELLQRLKDEEDWVFIDEVKRLEISNTPEM